MKECTSDFYFRAGDTNFQQRFGDNNNPDDHGGQQPLQQQQNGLHEEQNMQHQEEQNNQINAMQVNPPDLNPQVRTCLIFECTVVVLQRTGGYI